MLNGKVIKKPNNLDGVKVEVMISDIVSYEYAMNYMCAFNDRNKLLLFWDEPTISLDVDTSPLHKYISNVWSKNKIKNIILSSATLPNITEITPVIESFKNKFGNDSKIINVESNDNVTNKNNSKYLNFVFIINI